ncbi:Protein STU1 [Ceratocystis fimbriata CBS 114723]|uniref:Protein STU1 n=1 Tax=Ceratocystis fimbriata CBS 114723 TaxID=1035309 RepID=A0A2C5XC02_9PEZI|nr:Protein STU1 [Ceratocystis fimbriata CBS 114723]
MPEKLTDEFVADLLNLLRSDVYVDSKVSQVTYTKSSIKQFNVPETCTPALFEALRLASLSPHATLSMAGFTALNHLFTRLLRQESKLLAKEAPKNLSLVIERLGDQKEKLRALANQILINIYPVAPVDVERFVRNIAMSGKNVRAKEAALNWLLHMHQETGMPFRNYVPNLMDLLEDADPGVRETAKGTVIELFKNAPNRAKSDLKRQLKNCKVRPAIEQAIVKALIPTVGSEATSEDQPRANLAPSTSMPSLSSDRPVTPGNIETNAESLEPIYVNTVRELDDMFKEMLLYFDGRESEQNWLKREQSISKLRQLIVGNVPSDFQDQFLVGLKSLLDGIVKAITSLRTSLSKEGCALVQDAANVFGPGIDPLVEILLQTLIKLCAATKKIASQQANTSVEAIISRVTYSNRIMQHIWGASQDKNVQPRLYSTSWLKIILTKEGHHKSHIEHTGGLDIIEKCLKKGLNDANPGVRERSRGTYWLFSSMWPARAEAIMEGLDSTAQKLLTKDPANPNAGANTTTAKPGMGLSKSTMSARPTLRETMLAQKKAAALAAKKEPISRPGSAMAHLGATRSTAPTASAPTPVPAPPTRSRGGDGTTAVGPGGMSVAPVRPRRKAPEMTARPATAGPYSFRSNEQPPAQEQSALSEPRSKPVAPAKSASSQMGQQQTSPRRTLPRPRSVHGNYVSEPVHSPTRVARSPTRLSPSRLPSPTRNSFQSPTRASYQSPTRDSTSQPVTPRQSPSKIRAALSPSGATMLTPPKFKATTSSVSPKTDPPPREVPTLKEALNLSSSVHHEHEESHALANAFASVPKSTGTSAIHEQASNLMADVPSQKTPVANVVQVYEDPAEQQHTHRAPPAPSAGPVLADKHVNADTAPLSITNAQDMMDSDKAKVNARLLDSGITRVKAKTLDVHGFRKLQSLLREKTIFADGKFDSLLLGLFQYLEDPLPGIATDKAQDVKAQVLATIKLLLKNNKPSFQPHVSRALEAIMATRSTYDARTHIVSGLEALADDLVVLGSAPVLVNSLVALLDTSCSQDASVASAGMRCLSTGLHVLTTVLARHPSYIPGADGELPQLAGLAGRCLESKESAVRMGAVQLCVAVHARVGEEKFWEALKDVQDDPKSLITYYIVKRQRDGSE